ncbi:hypothetical protein [Amycolatopsis sp. NPDC021455]|uniref:hypothetical protein n=1 Tax=Amycolatopsis sp. NPDC021455 TaxID=3154901 RepID=UPI003403D834
MADEPDAVHTSNLTELVAGLLQGDVALLAWEDVGGPGANLDEWTLEVRETCLRAGVTPCFIRLEKPRMTLVLNEQKKAPSVETIRALISWREAERAARSNEGPPAEQTPS